MSILLETHCDRIAEDPTVKQSLQECNRRMTTIEHRENRWVASRVIAYTAMTLAMVLVGLALVGCLAGDTQAKPQLLTPVLPIETDEPAIAAMQAAPVDSPRPWAVIPMPAPDRHFGIAEQSQQEMLEREYQLQLNDNPNIDLNQLRYDIKILKIQVRELQQAVFRMKSSIGSSHSPAGADKSPLQFTIGMEPDDVGAPVDTKD